MAEEVLVNLVHDPYRIYAGEGHRVSGLADEVKAFHTIGDLLRNVSDPATRKPRTYILDRISWEHFRSLRSARGVRQAEYSPRGQIQSSLGAKLPEWLTDEAIVAWKLLQRSGPMTLVRDDWSATLSEWLFPGITNASSLQEWLVAAASSTDACGPIGIPQVLDWIYDSFRLLAALVIPLSEVVADLAEQLRESATPATFAKGLLRRRALLPIIRPAINRPLSVPGLANESAQDIARANYVPLPFPLPEPMQSEVSRLMSRAVRSAQLERPETFEQVAMNLNALWDGFVLQMIAKRLCRVERAKRVFNK